jgi:hypothetical protein
MNQGSRYLLRVYYPALTTDEGVKDLLRFISDAGIDEVLLFTASFDADQGLQTTNVLKKRAAWLRTIIPKVREAGASVAINMLCTLGYGNASVHAKDFPFQFQVNEYGQVSKASPCPLDPSFQEYVAAIYRIMALMPFSSSLSVWDCKSLSSFRASGGASSGTIM